VSDVEFFWDPICPYAWITSRWMEEVATLRGLEVDWRFINLRILNERRDYAEDFPEGYLDLHERGRRMSRVAAAARDTHGRAAMGPLYTALGNSIWEQPRTADGSPLDRAGTDEHLREVLRAAGLAEDLAVAADDPAHDAALRADTEDALARSGADVGTPIIAFDPPDGPAFFGPVISTVPRGEAALALFDAVGTLARWPGFSELKRTRRDWPDLPLLRG
jgi:2-hydroxychromene-2-carboxylate isomerase